MKLVMTMLVRDEIDIIEQNLSFHFRQGVDHAIVIDNGSIDGTRELLAKLERNGNVTVVDEPEQDYQQAVWMTRAAFMARDEFGADWVLNNDADEFWVPNQGSLKTVVANTPADVLHCPRTNLMFPWNQSEDAPWIERCVFSIRNPIKIPRLSDALNDSLPCPYFYLDLPGKVLTRTDGLIAISQGNHTARFDRQIREEKGDITILHFPVRSKAQFRSKVRNGGLAYARNSVLSKGAGWHVRRQFHLIEGQGLDAAIADALPDKAALDQDLLSGVVVQHLQLKELLGV